MHVYKEQTLSTFYGQGTQHCVGSVSPSLCYSIHASAPKMTCMAGVFEFSSGKISK